MHLNTYFYSFPLNFESRLKALEARLCAAQKENEMSETKIELIENTCGCSADGGQCCSSDEAKLEPKAEGVCCSN